MKTKYLRFLRIALSVATVLGGLCLCSACLWVYRNGTQQAYTPEEVAQALSAIAVPLWLWAVLAAVTGAVHILFAPDKKIPLEGQPEMTFRRLQARVDLSRCPEGLRKNLENLQRQRKTDARKALGLLALCSTLFLLYGANPNNYDSTKISTSVVTSIVLLCLAMIFPLASLLDAAHRAKISLRIEAQLLKTAPREARITPVEKKRFPWVVPSRLVLLGLAVALLLIGFLTSGTADVLTKAVNICTECVGLG